MTTFSNHRRLVTVEDNANGITIRGDFQIDSDNRISVFYGQVATDGWSGNFTYNERTDGNISFNIDNVPSGQRVSVENLIFAMVAEIHDQYNTATE